jgi:RNA 3'-terminal phosphate cyclase
VVKQKLSWSDDQLLMREINRNQGPGEGFFTTTDRSQHASTNAEIIKKFLQISISTQKLDNGVFAVKLTSNS